MSTLDQARATQLKNIEKKTGHSLDGLRAIIAESGLKKHGEIRPKLPGSLPKMCWLKFTRALKPHCAPSMRP
jgi:hypothetical protein